MRGAIRLHGTVCRPQRLTEYLTPKHLRTADVAAHAAKDVDFEPLQLEYLHQVGEMRLHQAVATPSRFCMAGLVVVYCRNCFLAGYRWCCTPNAASAAS